LGNWEIGQFGKLRNLETPGSFQEKVPQVRVRPLDANLGHISHPICFVTHKVRFVSGCAFRRTARDIQVTRLQALPRLCCEEAFIFNI
jgi:hypothetical protein